MKKIRYIAFTVFSLLLVVGCQRSILDQEITEPVEKNTVTFEVCAPKVGVVATRQADTPNEQTIYRGYIFIFSSDGAYKTFQKITKDDVKSNNSQYPVIETTVSGYNPTSDRIVAVFNYSADDFKGESNFASLTLENISDYFPMGKEYLAKLQSDFAGETFLLGMPMFVNDFDNADYKVVHKVYRALSKVQLYIKKPDSPADLLGRSHAFTTENVKYAVVNGAENGAIGFQSLDVINSVNGGEPLADVSGVKFEHTPREYSNTEELIDDKDVASAIYLYEFPHSTKVINGNGTTQGVYDHERLSILIEHIDEAAHPGVTHYYKLQLIDKTKNEYYDIKRNHDYRVVIRDVYSDGYMDKEEAYIMPPSNIEYEVFDDEGDMTFSNGQYAISMDQVLNYESVLIYGPETTTISFDNIRRILPDEVVGSLTAAEIEKMTNEVEFEVGKPSSDSLQIVVTKNDFETNKELTDEGKSIELQLTGNGECKVKLNIKLGNLKLGFDEITIIKVGNVDLGGNSSFDAHPCQLSLENINIIPGTWNSKDSDFGARNDGKNLIVYMGENATPVGFKTLNGYITTAAAENAYPYFEPKTREGYYSYYDLATDPDKTKPKKIKIVLNQLAPFYVGHFGSSAKGGPHYYNSIIVEKVEEIEDKTPWAPKKTGGLMEWSTGRDKIYYDPNKIYGQYLGLEKYLNFTEGLDITKHIVDNNNTEGAIPSAARYCYMKNDINGDGVIDPDKEPIVWYLPAVNQMMAMWISKILIDSEVDQKYYGFNLATHESPHYWTSSEVADTWDNVKLGAFGTNVARFNMLEGELSVGGKKGFDQWSTDYKAHVRCVRGIIYDNTK